MDCQFASLCWAHVGMYFDTRSVTYAPDWLLQQINERTELEICKIAAVLWGIWCWRNKKVWEGKGGSASMAMDWRDKKERNKMANPMVSKQTVKWYPPAEGKFKINVDAAVLHEAEVASIGMVIRDHTGLFVEGRVKKLLNQESVFAAEAMGVCEAVDWAIEKQLQDITIETDSLLIVRALQTRSMNALEVGNILQKCIKSLEENPSFEVVFVQRRANKVAHEMAKLPCLVDCYNLFTSPPNSMLEIIMSDVLS